MAFTPQSTLQAEQLDRLELQLEDSHYLATWRYFGEKSKSIDPVIEAFRARRSIYEKSPEHDVHIVIEHCSKDVILPDGRIRRRYSFSYCPYYTNYNDIPLPILHQRFMKLIRIIFAELTTLFDEWHDADNGMALFLKSQNKVSLDNFLIGMGYKIPSPKPKKKKTNAEKRASAAAYRAAHAEEIAKKKEKAKKNPPPDSELIVDAILGHA